MCKGKTQSDHRQAGVRGHRTTLNHTSVHRQDGTANNSEEQSLQAERPVGRTSPQSGLGSTFPHSFFTAQCPSHLRTCPVGGSRPALRTAGSTYPDELLGEGPAGVLRHVDGRDDPVTLLPPQPSGALVLGPRQQRVLWGLRGVQGCCLSFLREKSERYQVRLLHKGPC